MIGPSENTHSDVGHIDSSATHSSSATALMQRERSFAAMAQHALLAALVTTVFLNAVLLFSVEPMFSKILLPLLGGTPSVWNTCLVFFQGALLAGYGYAHFSTRWLGARVHPLVHAALLALSCLSLPLRVHAHGSPPPGPLAVLWLIMVLMTSLGVPFVMLASGAPVAQRWLADSNDRHAGNPYFLYAASNFGSLIALLSYPLLIEPWLSLSAQRSVWSAGYVLLVSLATFSAWLARRRASPSPRAGVPVSRSLHVVTARERASWIVYSAVPSGLLVAVTTYLSTDVAAVPLLWVVPLSAYLLTFVIVFGRAEWKRIPWLVRSAAYLLVIASIPILWNLSIPGLAGIILQLTLLFVVSLVCHGELAIRRPPVESLTEFFVWISVGGLLGGIFSALIAPVAFKTTAEYPILLTMAALLYPATAPTRRNAADVVLPMALGLALLFAKTHVTSNPAETILPVTVITGILVYSFRNRPLRFGLAIGLLFVGGALGGSSSANRLLKVDRSFFGVYRVEENRHDGLRSLWHGTTIHGAQAVSGARRLVPLTYYDRVGPVGDVFGLTFSGVQPQRRVAVVGLGVGALACYGRSGEQWTFYEIDPVVVSIARDPRLFTFLRDCSPAVGVVVGDARLSLVKAAASQYDIIVIDAFSSDAIPVHLLTREALQLYIRVTAPHGLFVFHISNRHLDLEPVVAQLAMDAGLAAKVRRDVGAPPSRSGPGRYASHWVVMARSMDDLGAIATDRQWQSLRRRARVHVWTDDFSNIMTVFRWEWGN